MTPEGAAWRRIIKTLFGLDARSLALFRIVLGIVLLCDVSIRYQDLHAFYTDEGVVPRGSMPPFHNNVCIHVLDGSLLYQAVLFYIHGFAALAIILGWNSRCAIPIAWLLTTSVQARNVLLLHGGDVLLRMLLFWSMFLPLSACWSLDSRARAQPPKRIATMGTFAFVMQMCLLYWSAGLMKWDNAWRVDGYALHMALSVGHFITPLAQALTEQRELLRFLTFATICLELFGPFLLFIPWRAWAFRLLLFFVFLGFHLGILLTMSMGTFQWVCIAAWTALLPGELWDWLERRLGSRPAAFLLSIKPVKALGAWLFKKQPENAPAGEMLPGVLHHSGPVNMLIAALLLYVAVWNINAWTEPHGPNDNAVLSALLDGRDTVQRHFPPQAHTLAYALGLQQGWGLFAPHPGKVHGWVLIVGTLEDGRQMNLLGGGPLSWERPASISDTYRNSRWRQYIMHLSALAPTDYGLRHSAAVYLNELWHAEHPEAPLVSVEIYNMREEMQPDYKPMTFEKWRVSKLDCATLLSDLIPVQVSQ